MYRNLLTWVLLALVIMAQAHQQKEAVTRVLFNDRTGNIEVMHRFLIHDAEHATKTLFGRRVDLLGESADRDRFSAYVHTRFKLVDQTGNPIRLNPLGSEIDGDHLWVYSESPIPGGLTELTVSQNALREVWSEQTNLVNVEWQNQIRSAVFDGRDTEITVVLSQP